MQYAVIDADVTAQQTQSGGVSPATVSVVSGRRKGEEVVASCAGAAEAS